jgi:hypothetical protein
MENDQIIAEVLNDLLEEYEHINEDIINSIDYGSANLMNQFHQCSWIESEMGDGAFYFSIRDYKYFYRGWARWGGGANIICFEFEGFLLPEWLQKALKDAAIWPISKN